MVEKFEGTTATARICTLLRKMDVCLSVGLFDTEEKSAVCMTSVEAF